MGRRHPAQRVFTVVWGDAHGGQEGWGDFNKKKDHAPRKVLSVGIVLVDDALGVTLAQSKDNRTGQYDHTIFIPRENIQEITDVTPG